MSKSIAKMHGARRRWLLPATVALLAGIGGVAGNLVAADLEQFLEPYRRIVWLVFLLSLLAAIALAIFDAAKKDSAHAAAPGSVSAKDRSVAVGGKVENSTIITGDANRIDGSDT